jgi:hypothetical protein
MNIFKHTQSLLHSITNVIDTNYSSDADLIDKLKIRQRKYRFKNIESVIDLMYIIQLHLPKLHMTKYETFMFNCGKTTLKTIKRLYKTVRADWDEKFSPQSSYESSIIQIFLEGLRDTENTLLQFFPDERKHMRNIERWIFLP